MCQEEISSSCLSSHMSILLVFIDERIREVIEYMRAHVKNNSKLTNFKK